MVWTTDDGDKPQSAPEMSSVAAYGQPALERGHLLAALSNAIVSIHKQFYGKGPTAARTHMSQDLVVVLLTGGFTRGEHTLSERGYAHEVVQSRLAMQNSVESEFRGAVESILERPVRSFMSANDPVNDVQAEIFVLFPLAESSTSGREAAIHPSELAESELAERAQRAREQHRELLSEHRALRSEQAQSREAVHRERERRG